jgi:Tat protein secretion system quality control protein TatD with DNase activity
LGSVGWTPAARTLIRMADQVAVFKMQVKLAIRLNKPLVLHIRGAESEAISALEEVKLPANWPIHRYEFKIFLSNDIYK